MLDSIVIPTKNEKPGSLDLEKMKNAFTHIPIIYEIVKGMMSLANSINSVCC